MHIFVIAEVQVLALTCGTHRLLTNFVAGERFISLTVEAFDLNPLSVRVMNSYSGVCVGPKAG